MSLSRERGRLLLGSGGLATGPPWSDERGRVLLGSGGLATGPPWSDRVDEVVGTMSSVK